VKKALADLVAVYPRSRLTNEQAETIINQIVEDLKFRFGAPQVLVAIATYRMNAMNRYYPTSGQLAALAQSEVQHERVMRSPVRGPEFPEPGPDGKPVSRPLRWWLQPKRFWKAHWRESEIPASEQEPYRNWIAAIKAGAVPYREPNDY